MAQKSLYKEIVDEYDAEKAYREKKVEARWREICELVSPKYGTFGTDTEWTDQRFDSIGTECSTLLAEGMFGNLCPADSKWFRYLFADPELNKSHASQNLLEEMSLHMLQVYNRSTFYDVGPEFLQIGNSFATASMDVKPEPGEDRIICTVDHPRSVYLKVNPRGIAEVSYVRRYLRPDQAVEEFGIENLDDSTKQAYELGSTDEIEFVEVVRPRKKWSPGSKLAKEWKYGIYVFKPGDPREVFVSESGSKIFPKAIWRWSLRGNEPYGWGPIDDTMPDIRTCNQMVRTMLLAQNKQADPAVYFPDEGRSWSTDPGSHNYYKDPNRRPYKDEISGYRTDIEMLREMQARVRKAMKIDHFLMLLQRDTKMTAREVVERKREGLSVVSSTVGKFETDALDRIHARMLSIEAENRRLPGYRQGDQLPEELQGKELKVEYLGPIPQQQKLVALESGIMSAIETAAVVFQFWPPTLDKVKAQILIDRIWQANDVTADSLRTDKEWTQLQEAKAAQAAKAEQDAMKQQVAGNIDPNAPPAPGSPAAAMMGAQ